MKRREGDKRNEEKETVRIEMSEEQKRNNRSRKRRRRKGMREGERRGRKNINEYFTSLNRLIKVVDILVDLAVVCHEHVLHHIKSGQIQNDIRQSAFRSVGRDMEYK